MSAEFSVITYQPRFKNVFRDLNRAWIEKYFKIEKKDVEQTDHPEVCVDEGGEVFFVIDVSQGCAVGTCAMYKIGEGRFELAKMAVDPKYQGRGLGDLLMKEAEVWARGKGAREILILSNTVLEPAIRLYKKHGYRVVHLGPHPDYERANIEMIKEIGLH